MGASFSAGGDLEWMKSMAKYKFEENLRDAEQLFNMFETIAECPLPVLGYIQGHAFGGGVGLAAVCDIAVAEESALFCFSEGRLGLVPAVISSFVAAKMHKNKMREYMLTARVFNAHQAHDAGLVEFVGRELESKEFFQQTLDAICNEGPEAVRETKKLLGFLRHHPKAAIKSESVRVIAERRVSAEGQEGIASFLAKRKPAWVK
jgi:methylglutaconyl-CoA hydratase